VSVWAGVGADLHRRVPWTILVSANPVRAARPFRPDFGGIAVMDRDQAGFARRGLAVNIETTGACVANRLTDEDEVAMLAELGRLRQDHRDLDAAIAALEQVGTPDRLQLQRLKKRKLGLKDRISFLEDQLTPDIIA